MLRPILFAAIATVTIVVAPPAGAATADNADINRYFEARIAEIDGRGGDALKNYTLLFKADASSPALAGRLYQNAMMQGDIASAIGAVRALELQNEADATAPLLLFADAFKRKDWNSADIAIAEMAAKSNFGFIAPVLKSWINVAQGKPHGFSAVAARDNSMLNYYANDQSAYLELASGNLVAAKPLLTAMRGIDAAYARDALIRAAPIYSAQKEADFARSLLRGVLEPSFTENYSFSGTKAQARLTAAQGAAAVFTRFSGALAEEKILDQAMIMARIAAYLSPDNEPAKLALANALFALRRPQQAMNCLDQISVQSPYAQNANSLKITWLIKDTRLAEATALAQRQVRLFPGSPRAILQLAQTIERQGDFGKAAETFKLLVENKASNAGSPRREALFLLYLAMATHKNGNWLASRGYLDEANRLDPNNPFILNYLGFTLLERREDIPAALGLVKQAYRLAPDSAAISDSLGWGYFLIGDYKQAVTLLEKAARLSANEIMINDHLGDAYWQAGRRVAARYAWKAAAYQATDAEKLRISAKLDNGLDQMVTVNKSATK